MTAVIEDSFYVRLYGIISIYSADTRSIVIFATFERKRKMAYGREKRSGMGEIAHVVEDNNYYRRCIKRDPLMEQYLKLHLESLPWPMTQEMSDRANFGEPLLLRIM